MSTLSAIPKALRNAAIAVSLALLTLGGGAMAADLPETQPIQAAQAAQPAATSATAIQAGDYAAREQASIARQLEQFQGGDTVIIGTSAIALVLVVLVLVVLL